MFWQQGLAFILGIIIWCLADPAMAVDWTHPLSFSNAELSRRDFSGESLQAAEFS
ncbi:MAG: pentapeptide repeat-containing protein, partial [Nostoc sp.]